jgi:hypothetical protein
VAGRRSVGRSVLPTPKRNKRSGLTEPVSGRVFRIFPSPAEVPVSEFPGRGVADLREKGFLSLVADNSGGRVRVIGERRRLLRWDDPALPVGVFLPKSPLVEETVSIPLEKYRGIDIVLSPGLKAAQSFL